MYRDRVGAVDDHVDRRRRVVVGVPAVAIVDEAVEPAVAVHGEGSVGGVDLEVDEAVLEGYACPRHRNHGERAGCPLLPAVAGDVLDAGHDRAERGVVDEHAYRLLAARSCLGVQLGQRGVGRGRTWAGARRDALRRIAQ